MTDFENTVDMLNRANVQFRYWNVDQDGVPVTALVTDSQVLYAFDSRTGALLSAESQLC